MYLESWDRPASQVLTRGEGFNSVTLHPIPDWLKAAEGFWSLLSSLGSGASRGTPRQPCRRNDRTSDAGEVFRRCATLRPLEANRA